MERDEFDKAVTPWLDGLMARINRPAWRWPYDPELRWLLLSLYETVARARDVGLTDEAARQPILQSLQALQPDKLRLEATLELGNRLREILMTYGDAAYLLSAFEEDDAYAKGPNTPAGAVSWKSLYGDSLPAAVVKLREDSAPSDQELDSFRVRLQALQRTSWHFYELERSRSSVKSKYMLLLAAILLLSIGGLCAGMDLATNGVGWQILLAAFAGGIGSLVSGAFKLRDQVATVAQLRAFAPAILVQPLVGATAGLFSLLVMVSGTINIGDSATQWAARGAVAFAIGFSEPFFLKTVNRVASLGEQ
jgi:hypothetical protein